MRKKRGGEKTTIVAGKNKVKRKCQVEKNEMRTKGVKRKQCQVGGKMLWRKNNDRWVKAGGVKRGWEKQRGGGVNIRWGRTR